MKKILLGLGLSVALLAGCGHKKTETNSNAADKKEISNNLPIIDNAKQQEVITRTLVFPKDERGNQQSQTVTYQGEHFKRLVIERLTATDDEMKEAIKQMGLRTAREVLNAPRDMIVEKADLEEDTVDHLLAVLRAEFDESAS